MFTEIDSAWGQGAALPDIAEVHIERGEPRAALAACLQAIQVLEPVDAQWHAAGALAIMVVALQADDRLDDAARVSGIVGQWHDQLGAPVFPVVAARYAESLELLESRLGTETFQHRQQEGRLLPHTAEFLTGFVTGSVTGSVTGTGASGSSAT